MRKVLLILLPLACASCAAVQQRYACEQQAGPKPDAAADLFGLAGYAIASQDPARQAWEARVEACQQEGREHG